MSRLDDIVNNLDHKLEEVPKIVRYVLGGFIILIIFISRLKKPTYDEDEKQVKQSYQIDRTLVTTNENVPAINVSTYIPSYQADANLDYIKSGLFGPGYSKIATGDGYGADRKKWRTPEQIARGNWYHKGQDFSAPLGTPIYSPHLGKVIKVNNSVQSSGGRSVTLLLDGGITLYLAHLSSIKVSLGQIVQRGTLVALSGGSGLGKEKGYDYHLHIQMKSSKDKDWVDPSIIRLGYSTDNLAMIGIGFFLDNGYTLDQSCGFIGNFYAESRFKTDAKNNSGGGRGAVGIAQWRGARIAHFEQWKGKPLISATFIEQLQFVIRELTHPSLGGDKKYSDYSIVKFNSRYKQSSGIANCTKLVYFNYERAGKEDKSLQVRINAATKYYNMYISLYGTTTTRDNNSFNESNSIYRKDLNK